MSERLSPPARLALIGSLMLNSACSGVNTFSVIPIFKQVNNGVTYGFQTSSQNGPVSKVELTLHINEVSLWKKEIYQLPGGGQTTTLDGMGLFINPATGKWKFFDTSKKTPHF